MVIPQSTLRVVLAATRKSLHLKPSNEVIKTSGTLSKTFVYFHRATPMLTRPMTTTTVMKNMYDNKIFVSTSNTGNGEVSAQTRFHYHQSGNIVWAEYAGGSIVRGSLIATIKDFRADGKQSSGILDMRYHHVNKEGQLMTGQCLSTPEILADGRLRMHEKWTWTSGDCSSGESIVEEVKE